MLNPITTTNAAAAISYDLNCVDKYGVAHTKNGWKVCFPEIKVQQDDDAEDINFKRLYAAAIESAEDEIMKHAEKMSTSNIPYTRGQWHKAVNASFSHATQKLHDEVMGHNGCDDLIFTLEVEDQRTIFVH